MIVARGDLRTADVVKASGATYRQMDYWSTVGLFGPENVEVVSGNRRTFTPTDVLIAAVVKAVVSMTTDLVSVGRLCQALREIPVFEWPDSVSITPKGQIVGKTDDADAVIVVNLARIVERTERCMAGAA